MWFPSLCLTISFDLKFILSDIKTANQTCPLGLFVRISFSIFLPWGVFCFWFLVVSWMQEDVEFYFQIQGVSCCLFTEKLRLLVLRVINEQYLLISAILFLWCRLPLLIFWFDIIYSFVLLVVIKLFKLVFLLWR